MKTRVEVNLVNHEDDNYQFGYSALITFCNKEGIIPISAYNLFKPFIVGKKYYNPHGNIHRESVITSEGPMCGCLHEKTFRCMQSKNVYCHTCSVKEGVEDHKKTCLKNFGVDNARKYEPVVEKGRDTCMRIYGKGHPRQSEEYNNSCIIADLKRNDGNHFFQTQTFKDKSKKTNQEKRGCDYASQCPIVKEKCRKTFKKRYGYDYYILSPQFQARYKQILMEKYGVEHPMHSQEIASRCTKHSYKSKVFKASNGKWYQYQGYENFMIERLIKEGVNAFDLVNESRNVPFIKWTDSEGKYHYHIVDMFIKSQNKCIEVKSEWTIDKQGKSNVRAKQECAKAQGYLYEVWIFNKKGEVLDIWS
jgi:hypothetical protein